MIKAYGNNLEHIQDTLKRLDLLIERAVQITRKPQQSNGISAPYISEGEIEQILSQEQKEREPAGEKEGDPLLCLIRQQVEMINQRVSESVKGGIQLQFPILTRIFGLSPFESDVILICLAPELDLKYQRLYGYLQNDITRTYPSIDLINNLLCLDLEEMIYARRFFSPDSPLMKYRILSYVMDPSEISCHFPAQMIKLDHRIADFLLMSNTPDLGISPYCSLIKAPDMRQDPAFSKEIQTKIIDLVTEYLEKEAREHLIFYLYGPDSEGKRRMVESVCSTINLPLLSVDMKALVSKDGDFEKQMWLVFREGLLQTSAVYLDHIDCRWEQEEDASSSIKVIHEILSKMGWVVFMSGKSPWPNSGYKEDQFLFEFEFPVLAYQVRRKYWEAALNGKYPLAGDIDLDSIAGKFRFTCSQIRDAVITARNKAYLRDGKDFRITGEDLYCASRFQSNQKLIRFGQKILPKYTWKDIVLPEDMLSQLKELCNHVAFHAKVYGGWGFDRKHSLGKGLNILFAGVSGTGKTMAAEIIANELRLDLYKIDLSTVVSKYIGETEKNLSKIFIEAETSNAILFFDEADALFGKRSEVKDSHDRYANIEINYLLQKMEEHEGIVILATNLSKNIDEAFVRRVHFSLNFPFPEKEKRLHIWRGIFPEEAPLSQNVDFRFLARQLNITGGNIKNIALRAAFMAAADSGTIGMEHIMLASKREFQKIGRLCVEADFKTKS